MSFLTVKEKCTAGIKNKVQCQKKLSCFLHAKYDEHVILG